MAQNERREEIQRTDITICHRRIHGGFARVHEEFARIHKNVRRVRGWVHNGGFTNRFARVREGSRYRFARVREGYTDGFTTDIRRIRGLTQIRAWIHSGFTRVLTQCSQLTAVNPFMAFDKSALIYTVACTYNHDD